jgi:hypothetical protein
MPLHQRIDAVGGGECLFQQLLDQQHRGALAAQLELCRKLGDDGVR